MISDLGPLVHKQRTEEPANNLSIPTLFIHNSIEICLNGAKHSDNKHFPDQMLLCIAVAKNTCIFASGSDYLNNMHYTPSEPKTINICWTSGKSLFVYPFKKFSATL